MKSASFFIAFWALLNLGAITPSLGATPTDKLTETQRAYLQTIYKDTFRFIDDFTDKKTNLPYDSNHLEKKATSTTNIGFYLACVAIAGKTNVIESDLALKKIQQTLESLEKIPTWLHFPLTWVEIDTLNQAYGTSFSYADHLGNLIASLLVVKQLYPETNQKIVQYLENFQLKLFYDPSTKWLKGGYDTRKKDFTIKQLWGNWYYNLAGADTRFLSFYGIAKGDFPPEHWTALNWNTEKKYEHTYLQPGWQGGGLFMQYITGIFLDEKNQVVGKSAKNFAAAQIKHAQKNNYAVWGWSAAQAPWGEYRGWGKIMDRVVSPHASVLAIEDFPDEVIANLKKLDEMNLRIPWHEKNYGYRDSVDILSGKTTDTYLMLDQAMLFLSLANYLHEGIVRKNCMADPVVQRGFRILYSEKKAA